MNEPNPADKVCDTLRKLADLLQESGEQLVPMSLTIRGPGKFEGERFHALYWYDVMLNGDGDLLHSTEDGDSYESFTLLPYEHAALNVDEMYALLHTSSSGFVTLSYVNELPEFPEEPDA